MTGVSRRLKTWCSMRTRHLPLSSGCSHPRRSLPRRLDSCLHGRHMDRHSLQWRLAVVRAVLDRFDSCSRVQPRVQPWGLRVSCSSVELPPRKGGHFKKRQSLPRKRSPSSYRWQVWYRRDLERGRRAILSWRSTVVNIPAAMNAASAGVCDDGRRTGVVSGMSTNWRSLNSSTIRLSVHASAIQAASSSLGSRDRKTRSPRQTIRRCSCRSA